MRAIPQKGLHLGSPANDLSAIASNHYMSLKLTYKSEEKSMIDPARIVLDPTILAGKPVIRGTRLSVDFVIGLMADGWNEKDILRNYPGLSHDDLAACLAYARDVLRSEKVYPSAA
jgi:uncharacterized protein (DUF433 family)